MQPSTLRSRLIPSIFTPVLSVWFIHKSGLKIYMKSVYPGIIIYMSRNKARSLLKAIRKAYSVK